MDDSSDEDNDSTTVGTKPNESNPAIINYEIENDVNSKIGSNKNMQRHSESSSTKKTRVAILPLKIVIEEDTVVTHEL